MINRVERLQKQIIWSIVALGPTFWRKKVISILLRLSVCVRYIQLYHFLHKKWAISIASCKLPIDRYDDQIVIIVKSSKGWFNKLQNALELVICYSPFVLALWTSWTWCSSSTIHRPSSEGNRCTWSRGLLSLSVPSTCHGHHPWTSPLSTTWGTFRSDGRRVGTWLVCSSSSVWKRPENTSHILKPITTKGDRISPYPT